VGPVNLVRWASPTQHNSPSTAMSDRAAILATAPIRNFDEVPLTRMLREPLLDKSTPFEVIEMASPESDTLALSRVSPGVVDPPDRRA